MYLYWILALIASKIWSVFNFPSQKFIFTVGLFKLGFKIFHSLHIVDILNLFKSITLNPSLMLFVFWRNHVMCHSGFGWYLWGVLNIVLHLLCSCKPLVWSGVFIRFRFIFFARRLHGWCCLLASLEEALNVWL